MFQYLIGMIVFVARMLDEQPTKKEEWTEAWGGEGTTTLMQHLNVVDERRKKLPLFAQIRFEFPHIFGGLFFNNFNRDFYV